MSGSGSLYICKRCQSYQWRNARRKPSVCRYCGGVRIVKVGSNKVVK